uniref:Uncharacterized protein n=1 Tax=Anguilla anguilla TaxID=7936 RepID=A0A0E9X2Z9_ANGAN
MSACNSAGVRPNTLKMYPPFLRALEANLCVVPPSIFPILEETSEAHRTVLAKWLPSFSPHTSGRRRVVVGEWRKGEE